VKVARLFSNSEYIDVVLACGEMCGSAPRLLRISVRLFLVHFYSEKKRTSSEPNFG
jgi:hypothetical protein